MERPPEKLLELGFLIVQLVLNSSEVEEGLRGVVHRFSERGLEVGVVRDCSIELLVKEQSGGEIIRDDVGEDIKGLWFWSLDHVGEVFESGTEVAEVFVWIEAEVGAFGFG